MTTGHVFSLVTLNLSFSLLRRSKRPRINATNPHACNILVNKRSDTCLPEQYPYISCSVARLYMQILISAKIPDNTRYLIATIGIYHKNYGYIAINLFSAIKRDAIFVEGEVFCTRLTDHLNFRKKNEYTSYLNFPDAIKSIISSFGIPL